MSRRKKLPGIGRPAPCPTCGLMGEVVFGQYVECSSCDPTTEPEITLDDLWDDITKDQTGKTSTWSPYHGWLKIAGITVLLGLVIAGCGRTLSSTAIQRRATPYCLTVTLGRGQQGEACVERLETCQWIAAYARRWGSMGGIRAVAHCRYAPEVRQ